MHCLLCKYQAGEITECEPIDGVIVCQDCAHDECLIADCEYCLGSFRSDEMVQADDESGTSYCASCAPFRYRDNGIPKWAEKGWKLYNEALSKEALRTTTTDLGNALSNMLKVAS